MIAIGETPERVRVGDLRSRARRLSLCSGTKSRMSELRRKGARCFSHILIFSCCTSIVGFEARMDAASFAAKKSALFCRALIFLGKGRKAGREPVFCCIAAASLALCAECESKQSTSKKARVGAVCWRECLQKSRLGLGEGERGASPWLLPYSLKEGRY